MSQLIHLLPDTIANQIAAGEVIQRPASVVKELMENAVDAKANKVHLIIKNAGKSLVQVIDDGIGMSEIDARMCFERHATSKIRNIQGLFQLKTMGFRGEALASIASVAQVELKTRQITNDIGTGIRIEGNELKKQDFVSTPVGTNFMVKNLFFNVPARRKFLKSDPVELKHIIDEFLHVALAYPEIGFLFTNNQNEVYRLYPGNIRQRIQQIFGNSISDGVLPIEEESSEFRLSGYVGKPLISKKSRGEQYIFVNQRYIKSNYLNHAINLGYDGILVERNFPFYVLFLDIDPSMIDVNIHPTKSEIKFENEKIIYNYLRVAVRKALGKFSVTPSLDFEVPINLDTSKQATGKIEEEFGKLARKVAEANTDNIFDPISKEEKINISRNFDLKRPSSDEKKSWDDFYESFKSIEVEKNENEPKSQVLSFASKINDYEADQPKPSVILRRGCFQLNEQKIVSSISSGILVVDQEVASRRILYEKYKNIKQNSSFPSQELIFPEKVDLTLDKSLIFQEILDDFCNMGYQVEHFGDTSYLITACPTFEIDIDKKTIIEGFIDSYIEETHTKSDHLSNIAAAFSRQHSLKHGQKLNETDMELIIGQLFACENPYTDHKGDKCFVVIENSTLDQMF